MSSLNTSSRSSVRSNQRSEDKSGSSVRTDDRDGTGTPAANLPAAPNELDIVRHLLDTRARVEVASAANRRQAQMQRLMARIHLLSDREFESAYHALDGMIETFAQAKAGKKESSQGKPANDVVSDAQASLEKTMEKSLGRAMPGVTRIQGT